MKILILLLITISSFSKTINFTISDNAGDSLVFTTTGDLEWYFTCTNLVITDGIMTTNWIAECTNWTGYGLLEYPVSITATDSKGISVKKDYKVTGAKANLLEFTRITKVDDLLEFSKLWLK